VPKNQNLTEILKKNGIWKHQVYDENGDSVFSIKKFTVKFRFLGTIEKF
jgi:hypothetical protein